MEWQQIRLKKINIEEKISILRQYNGTLKSDEDLILRFEKGPTNDEIKDALRGFYSEVTSLLSLIIIFFDPTEYPDDILQKLPKYFSQNGIDHLNNMNSYVNLSSDIKQVLLEIASKERDIQGLFLEHYHDYNWEKDCEECAEEEDIVELYSDINDLYENKLRYNPDLNIILKFYEDLDELVQKAKRTINNKK